MTPEQLKTSILFSAFQGKLVEQRTEEGNADSLFDECKRDFSVAIKQGKIKRQKALSPITEEDILFDIPSTWTNIKLGEVVQLLDGEKLKGKEYKYLEVKYLRGNIEAKTITEGKFARKGQLVILVDGENSGEVFTLPEDGYLGSTFKLLYIVETLDIDYVLKFFELKRSELRANKKGAAIPHLNKDLLFNYVMPLPPLEEQHRIVEKIEELTPYIGRYTKAYEKLAHFNAKFPEEMKKSILEYAIMGKLVEHRSEEGTAEKLLQDIDAAYKGAVSEGRLKRIKPIGVIKEEEYPFDIPETWKWVYVNDIAFVTKLAGFEYTKFMAGSITNDGEVPIVRAKNIKPNKFMENEEEFISLELSKQLQRCALDSPCVLMTFIGAGIGEVAIFENKKRNHLAPNVAKIVPHVDINKYMLYYFMSPTGQQEIFKFMKAVAQPSLSMDTIRQVKIPIPPLEEQRRIVSKVEELLPYCNRLINQVG